MADARTNQDVLAGMDFVCAECGKPLLLLGAPEPAGNKRAVIVVAVVLLVLLLAGGAVAWSLSKSKPTGGIAEEAPAPLAQPPESGTCSDADAKVGLCRRKE
jgi:hypothetical protein